MGMEDTRAIVGVRVQVLGGIVEGVRVREGIVEEGVQVHVRPRQRSFHFSSDVGVECSVVIASLVILQMLSSAIAEMTGCKQAV
jgi:hypothetical protein